MLTMQPESVNRALYQGTTLQAAEKLAEMHALKGHGFSRAAKFADVLGFSP